MGGAGEMENEPTPPMTAALEKDPPHPSQHGTQRLNRVYYTQNRTRFIAN
jgi:hypothetical protein